MYILTEIYYYIVRFIKYLFWFIQGRLWGNGEFFHQNSAAFWFGTCVLLYRVYFKRVVYLTLMNVVSYFEEGDVVRVMWYFEEDGSILWIWFRYFALCKCFLKEGHWWSVIFWCVFPWTKSSMGHQHNLGFLIF